MVVCTCASLRPPNVSLETTYSSSAPSPSRSHPAAPRLGAPLSSSAEFTATSSNPLLLALDHTSNWFEDPPQPAANNSNCPSASVSTTAVPAIQRGLLFGSLPLWSVNRPVTQQLTAATKSQPRARASILMRSLVTTGAASLRDSRYIS